MSIAAGRERDLVVAELDVLRAHVTGGDPGSARARLARARSEHDGPGTLDQIEAGFGLTGFERALFLLTCAPDLVGEVGRELAEHTGAARISLGGALTVLPEPHWDALTPHGPLRHWELVRPLDPDGWLASPLVADERLVHQLAGAGHLDERLTRLSQPVVPPPWLPPTLAALATEVEERWRAGGPVLLRGPQAGNLRSVAAAACAAAGLVPRLLGRDDLPTGAADLALLVRRMVRETVLGGVGWLIDLDEGDAAVAALGKALTTCDAPVALLSSGLSPGGTTAALSRLELPLLEVPRLGVGERQVAIASALRRAGTAASGQELDYAAGAFDLPVAELEIVAREVTEGRSLWSACRRRPRAEVGGLAQVRRPRATWADLVLPEPQLEQLRALASAIRHRATVLDAWGFADRLSRGLGTAALFTGPSGTGKTLAAEVIAHDLALDLVQVDLSQVVSKYIGETEKQLARLFDAAENGGMVLLFDEADALFGKRSEVKDSHDRYANLEIGYLLQRLESFAGLAVLTTNARASLDQAFTRRLAMVVTFPYPDRESRERMWEQILPADLPAHGVDVRELAEADLSGGGIAAAALQAAYLAAEDGCLEMGHLAQAVRWELAKSGRAATSTRSRAPSG